MCWKWKVKNNQITTITATVICWLSLEFYLLHVSSWPALKRWFHTVNEKSLHRYHKHHSWSWFVMINSRMNMLHENDHLPECMQWSPPCLPSAYGACTQGQLLSWLWTYKCENNHVKSILLHITGTITTPSWSADLNNDLREREWIRCYICHFILFYVKHKVKQVLKSLQDGDLQIKS